MPALIEDEPRDTHVHMKMTVDRYLRLKKLADKNHVSINAYLHWKVFGVPFRKDQNEPPCHVLPPYDHEV